MGKRGSIELSMSRGEWPAGDPVLIPDGYVASLTNFLLRPGRLEARPPAVYDGQANVSGLMIWEDIKNQRTRFVAAQRSGGAATDIQVVNQTVAGSSWDSASSAIASGGSGWGYVNDYTNYGGKLYFTTTSTSDVPTGVFSWDGTTLSSTPFNSSISARCVTAFGDRVFLGSPYVSVVNLGGTTDAYDWTSASWTKTNVNVSFATVASGVKVCRLGPTNTGASACNIEYVIGGLIALSKTGTEQKYRWRGDFRGTHQTYEVPYTLEWVYGNLKSSAAIAYSLGELRTMTASDGANYRYRITTAGTTAAGVLVPDPKPGSVTADGTANWTNEGPEVLSALEGRFGTSDDGWQTLTLECTVPAVPTGALSAGVLRPRIKFYNTTTTTCATLAAVEISYKDGITDGDARKANKGQQWTAGDYNYPFFNQESSATATVNLETVVWSEIAEPKQIRAINYYEPKDVAGVCTALEAVGGKLLLFKRRGMWQFSLTADPDTPIVLDTSNEVTQATRSGSANLGCLGSVAFDTYGDEAFWVGEHEAYRMRIGEIPKPICGPAMRERIMGRRATWVESGGATGAKRALLSIDPVNREVWVYTQTAILFCYSMDSDSWSEHVVANSAEINALRFNPNTAKMEFVSTSGDTLMRLDHATASLDHKSSSSGADTNVAHSITFKPIALRAPRYDLVIQDVTIYEKVGTTYKAEDQTMTYAYQQGGTTYSKTVTQDLDVAGLHGGGFVGVRFPAFQHADSVTITFSHSGSTGTDVLQLSQAETAIEVKRGFYPKINPAAVSASL